MNAFHALAHSSDLVKSAARGDQLMRMLQKVRKTTGGGVMGQLRDQVMGSKPPAGPLGFIQRAAMDTQRAASNVATGRLRPGDLDAHIYRAAYGPADNFSGLVKERMAAAPPGWEDAGVETLLGVLSQRPALRNAMATSLKNFRYAARFGAKKSAPSSDAIAVP